MKDINKVLRESMYNFVKVHVDEVTEKKNIFGHDVTYDDLGFKSKDDMLSQIKKDADIAYWALTELLVWGLAKNYCREIFVAEETDTFTVFRFFDSDVNQRYLICNYEPHKPIEIKEVRKVTKFVEVNTWEDMV